VNPGVESNALLHALQLTIVRNEADIFKNQAGKPISIDRHAKNKALSGNSFSTQSTNIRFGLVHKIESVRNIHIV
jgi:hypothetical protein